MNCSLPAATYKAKAHDSNARSRQDKDLELIAKDTVSWPHDGNSRAVKMGCKKPRFLGFFKNLRKTEKSKF